LQTVKIPERSHGDELRTRLDLVEEPVDLGGRSLSLLRPRDSEALLDEEAFEHEEFLPYWAELWPSGVALAERIARREVAGAAVLELGCGLALPSFAAVLGGARVLATDWSPDAVELARRNAERNGLELDIAVCAWDDPAQLVQRAPWDLVLAADVLYERRNGELLLELLPRLVGDAGEVLLADPERPGARPFLDAAEREWRVEPLGPPAGRVRVVHMTRRERGARRPRSGAAPA
jgi:predicted nicotinamide N-methyase